MGQLRECAESIHLATFNLFGEPEQFFVFLRGELLLLTVGNQFCVSSAYPVRQSVVDPRQ